MIKRAKTGLKSLAEKSMLALVDLGAILLSIELAVTLRTRVLPLFYGGFPDDAPFGVGYMSLLIVLIWLFFLFYEGLYTGVFPFWDEVRTIWKASMLSAVGVLAIISLGKLSEHISRTAVVLTFLLSMVLIPTFRMLVKPLLRKLNLLNRRALIIGAGNTGRLIARALKNDSNYGYEIMGFVDDDPGKAGDLIDGIKVHPGVDSTERYLKLGRITDLFIAMPGAGNKRVNELITKLQHKVPRIMLVPDVFGVAVYGTTLQHFFNEQAFAFEVKNNLANPVNLFLKRCFDLLCCLISLPLLLPLMLGISLAIRSGSSGSAIFIHKRVGRNLKDFSCFKFRTMSKDAEKELVELLGSSAEARQEWDTYRKIKNDPRVTRIGRFLRLTSLDELPQIINVLKGEMSLVGPRPVTRNEIDEHYKDDAELCFSVPPGMTGLWQVSGRSTTSYEHRIGLDSWYVKNWNLWLDVIILIRTVRVVLKKGWSA